MALPLIGVGLMYRRATSARRSTRTGTRSTPTPTTSLTRLPIRRAPTRSGEPLTVSVPLPERELFAAVWLVQVGRVPVLLLDTDVPANDDADRPITHILYVRGREMRLHQELVLGVGGVRALRELGLTPAVWHLNEGHSAFLLAERARELVAAGETLDDAFSAVRRNSVFTIHTPVAGGQRAVRRRPRPARRRPAARRRRSPEDRRRARRAPARARAGVENDTSQFDMTAFSPPADPRRQRRQQLHAQTANATWQDISPGEILGITNGVHTPTWVGQPMRDTLERSTERRPRHAGRPARRAAVLGSHRQGARGRAVGGAPAPEAGARDLRPRPAAQPVRAPRRGARRRSRSSRTSSTRRSSRSASPAGSRPTSAPPCCSPTSTAWRACCGTRSGRSRSSSRARPTPPTGPARASSRTSSAARAAPSSAAACSSSRTTTSGSPGSSSRASTSGSTTRAARWRRRARRA